MDIDHIFKQATGTLLSRVILSAEKLSLNSFLLKLKKGLLFAFCRSISVSEINFVFSRWRESKCGYEFVWRESAGLKEYFFFPANTHWVWEQTAYGCIRNIAYR